MFKGNKDKDNKKKRKSMKDEFEDEIPRKKKKKGQLWVETNIKHDLFYNTWRSFFDSLTTLELAPLHSINQTFLLPLNFIWMYMAVFYSQFDILYQFSSKYLVN